MDADRARRKKTDDLESQAAQGRAFNFWVERKDKTCTGGDDLLPGEAMHQAEDAQGGGAKDRRQDRGVAELSGEHRVVDFQ